MGFFVLFFLQMFVTFAFVSNMWGNNVLEKGGGLTYVPPVWGYGDYLGVIGVCYCTPVSDQHPADSDTPANMWPVPSLSLSLSPNPFLTWFMTGCLWLTLSRHVKKWISCDKGSLTDMENLIARSAEQYCLLICRVWYVLLVWLHCWSPGYLSGAQLYISHVSFCSQLTVVSVLTACDASVINLISGEQGVWEPNHWVGTHASFCYVVSFNHVSLIALVQGECWSQSQCKIPDPLHAFPFQESWFFFGKSRFNSSTRNMHLWHHF